MVTASAQYPMGFPMGMGSGLGWGTEAGSPAWCWQQQQLINAQNAYIMQMRMQNMNTLQQQVRNIESQIIANPIKPVEGVFVRNDGTIFSYDTMNQYEKREVDCEHCNGGYNTKTLYLGNGNVRTIKDRCNYCHGKGTVTKQVLKE